MPPSPMNHCTEILTKSRVISRRAAELLAHGSKAALCRYYACVKLAASWFFLFYCATCSYCKHIAILIYIVT
jgi:hypothetical protein